MKVLIAHKNRMFCQLLSSSVFHKYRVKPDYVNSGEQLVLSNVDRYDVIMASVDMFGFSAVDAFYQFKGQKAKAILLLNTVEEIADVSFIGLEISLVDCSLESCQIINALLDPEVKKPYVSESVTQYIGQVIEDAKKQTSKDHPLMKYTVRELLWYICNDSTSMEFAKKVGQSKTAVEKRRAELKRLIGVKGLTGLINFAIENEVISRDQL